MPPPKEQLAPLSWRVRPSDPGGPTVGKSQVEYELLPTDLESSSRWAVAKVPGGGGDFLLAKKSGEGKECGRIGCFFVFMFFS